jgi:hypothetical protein
MGRKHIPETLGFLSCEACRLVYAEVTDDSPTVIDEVPYEFKNALTKCGKCSGELTILTRDRFSELTKYKHRGGRRGY